MTAVEIETYDVTWAVACPSCGVGVVKEIFAPEPNAVCDSCGTAFWPRDVDHLDTLPAGTKAHGPIVSRVLALAPVAGFIPSQLHHVPPARRTKQRRRLVARTILGGKLWTPEWANQRWGFLLVFAPEPAAELERDIAPEAG